MKSEVKKLAEIIENDCDTHKKCPYVEIAYNCKECFVCLAQAILDDGWIHKSRFEEVKLEGLKMEDDTECRSCNSALTCVSSDCPKRFKTIYINAEATLAKMGKLYKEVKDA